MYIGIGLIQGCVAVSVCPLIPIFFFSSRRRHTRFSRDWSSDVCSSDLLKFDLSGVRTKIAKATLTLTCIHPSTDGGTVYPVASSSWPEGNRTGLDKTSANGPGLKWKDVDTNRNGQIDPRDSSPYVPDFTRPSASLVPVLPGQSSAVDVSGALATGVGVCTRAISILSSA